MITEQKEFELYLQGLNHTEKTVNGHLQHFGYFDAWVTAQGIDSKHHINTSTILQHIKFMKSNTNVVDTQNMRLNTLRKYYDFLKGLGIITRNPAKGIYIKGKVKTVVINPLAESELTELYVNYIAYLDTKPVRRNIPQQLKINERYRLIVSLMVFQGLHTGELDKLTVQDINIEQGVVYVPALARSNSRVLKLDSIQIIPFYQYINELPAEQEKLFCIEVQKSMPYILAELKGINPMVKNALHIRSSVLMSWIRKHRKLEAKRMIGHKFVSTTERYDLQDTKELGDLMEKAHLFG